MTTQERQDATARATCKLDHSGNMYTAKRRNTIQPPQHLIAPRSVSHFLRRRTIETLSSGRCGPISGRRRRTSITRLMNFILMVAPFIPCLICSVFAIRVADNDVPCMEYSWNPSKDTKEAVDDKTSATSGSKENWDWWCDYCD